MELAKRVDQNKFNITAVNSSPFLGSNESYSNQVRGNSRFPKLVVIINIILYLYIGYIMLKYQTTPKSQQLNKKKYFKYVFFPLYVQCRSTRWLCSLLSLTCQAQGSYILTYTSPISRVLVRKEMVREGSDISITSSHILQKQDSWPLAASRKGENSNIW